MLHIIHTNKATKYVTTKLQWGLVKVSTSSIHLLNRESIENGERVQ